MKKVLSLGFWLVLFGANIFTMAFVESNHHKQLCDTLIVDVDYKSQQYFVTEKEVENILEKQEDSLFLKPIEEINISLLEESLQGHPSIRNAEVYSTIIGELRVKIKQKQPIARVMAGKKSYYIDEEGDKMSLSSNYSSRVPLIFGALNEEKFDAVKKIALLLARNAFWKAQIISMKFTDLGWVLHPRFGAKEIIIGKADALETKLKKLDVFYKKVLPVKGLDAYKKLDVRFEEQVVATK